MTVVALRSYAFQFIEEELESLVEQARKDLQQHYSAYRQRLLARSQVVEHQPQSVGDRTLVGFRRLTLCDCK